MIISNIYWIKFISFVNYLLILSVFRFVVYKYDLF